MSLEARDFFPQLQRYETLTTSQSKVVSYISNLGEGSPILILLHGYPQSAFSWRHVVATLLGKVSLFIPELPGYGISTPTAQNSRMDIAGALIEAFQPLFRSTPENPRKVILGGHDRGAGICHRIAVSKTKFASITIIGTILMDIIPAKAQWDKFQNPAIAQAYFHWPFLANVEMATQMLLAFGGGKWCRAGHIRLAGSEEGLRRMKADDAIEVYATLFDKAETLQSTCKDFAATATHEYALQAEDQNAERKIDVPTMVMFSQAPGKRIDVAKEWEDWIVPGVAYQPVPVESGHFLPEEAYDVVSENILSFVVKCAS